MPGRPRVHDRDDIARQLIEWAKKPDSINLSAFCVSLETPIAPSIVVSWTYSDPEFKKSYDIAKCYIAARREVLLNSELLNQKTFEMNAKHYDYFLRHDCRDQQKFEAALGKKSDDISLSEDTLQKLSNVLKAQPQVKE